MSHHHNRIGNRALERWARAVKDRAGWRCQHCGKAGKLEADHIVPLDRGGAALDLANGQALCRACHLIKTRSENAPDSVLPGRAEWRERVVELTHTRCVNDATTENRD